MRSIQPIQTRYNGCHYRSRTDARWAVFFDTAAIGSDAVPWSRWTAPTLGDVWLELSAAESALFQPEATSA